VPTFNELVLDSCYISLLPNYLTLFLLPKEILKIYVIILAFENGVLLVNLANWLFDKLLSLSQLINLHQLSLRKFTGQMAKSSVVKEIGQFDVACPVFASLNTFSL
jgi:hypothetical protein